MVCEWDGVGVRGEGAEWENWVKLRGEREGVEEGRGGRKGRIEMRVRGEGKGLLRVR